MTINKGLTSLVNASPNFSNQALENAINDIKSVDKDDGYSWIKSSIDADTAIEDNTVLTASQKNDLKDTINNQSHLNIGRYLNDVIRHTSSILDGSIIPGDPDILTADNGAGTFIEILQLVQGLQGLIPSLYGVPAGELNRDVNDHLGTLNNKFLETEDSSKPVFTSLKDTLSYLDAMARTTSSLATATAAVRYSNTQLITFLASVVADSTDFQTSLDLRASQLAGNYTNLHNQLASEPYLTKRNLLIADRDEINTQVALETSNVSGIRTYTETLTDNMGYTSLAEDTELRKLMARVSQNADWQTYFNDYETNSANLNPIYNIDTDSDKASVIDRVLREKGLPDVLDYVDLDEVANKAKKDTRIDTKNFDYYTTEQIITKCCEQLGITTSNNTVYNQSKLLLNNLNQRDRDIIAEALDLNESSNTLS
jgi:hypothetical protein